MERYIYMREMECCHDGYCSRVGLCMHKDKEIDMEEEEVEW